MADHDSAAKQGNAQADDHEHEHHGTGIYWLVFLALCGLTTLSFLTYLNFWRDAVAPEASRLFMLAVAVSKATLVMLFFMHLKWEKNWKYVLTIPSLMMAIFLMLALVPDIGLRTYHYSVQRAARAAEPVVGARADHHEAHEAHGASSGH